MTAQPHEPSMAATVHDRMLELPEEARAALLVGRDPDQAWFWTPEWKAGEREADEDIRA